MANVTLSLKRSKSEQDYTCGVCGASFMPLEDSGARHFTIKSGDQEPVTAWMCGGCYSKWSGGATVTLKSNAVTNPQ
ncbi:MAG: hypothetical protein ABIQ52_05780 [Vicinamibacterales bacterium]